MPTGAVRWFDAEKGYGFLTTDDGEDVFVHIKALPQGTTDLQQGPRVDFSVAEGRKGKQALSVTVQDAPPSVVKANRRPADQLASILEDLIKTLDDTSNQLRSGRYPDDASARRTASVLRAVANDLDV
ncbi:MAG: cold shock domain-containing protein [Actinomycetia bacterium]|nr:cold shock domain-containing protein [Actinomycetes bacterium]